MKKIIAVFSLFLVSFTVNDNKQLTVSLPFDKWQQVVNAIAASDGVTARQATELNSEIVKQINKQMDTSLTK